MTNLASKRIFALLILLVLLVPLRLNSQSSKIIDVKVQGNKNLKSEFVRQFALVKPGQELDSLRLESDMRRLRRLPAVAHAYYQVFPSNGDGYNVFYNIDENFTLIPSANIYTTNDDEFAFRLGLAEFNLLGRAINIGGFYQDDIFSSYGISLRAPYLFGPRWGIAINHQNLTTLEPVFFDDTTADYRYNNISNEFLILYEPSRRHRIELGVNFFTEEYEYRSGATSPEVPQDLEIDKYLYKLIYDYDNLDYFFHYVSGFRSLLNFQYVKSSDNALPEFLIGFNDFLYFKRVGKRGNWASRLRLGLSTNNDSPFAPFSVDNNLNIRGVGNTIDRGTGAIVLNTEFRYTLMEKNWFVLQGNGFVDTGSWRNPGGDLGDFGDAQNLRIYPGLGVRFIHKRIFNAILRIDYGFGITEDATRGFVFGIGQYF